MSVYSEAALPVSDFADEHAWESATFVLRFISGKYEGGEFVVADRTEVLIGRASDADLVLVEDLVSRHHATLSRKGHLLKVCDLNSTNGTFLNGARVKRAELEPGDRLLIGTNILKVEVRQTGSSAPISAQRRLMGAEKAAGKGPKMRGDLEEIPVVDLVQLLANAKKSGVLVLRSFASVGKIHFKEGQIVFAESTRLLAPSPRKALFRLLALSRGHFELEAQEAGFAEAAFTESTEHLIIEAIRHQDEVTRLLEHLPDTASALCLPTPLKAPLEEISPEDIDLLQSALNAASVRELLDTRSEADLEILGGLERLIAGGYLCERKD